MKKSRRLGAYSFNQKFPRYSESIRNISTPILPPEEKEMKTDLIKNEDGTYTLTLGQIEDLSSGKIKLIDGRLYLDASQIMKGPSAFNSKKDLTHESSHPNFNQPTQTQIERCKQFPQFPEIKGIHLKSSKLSIETQEAVKSLIAVIENDNTEHPYVWVERANVLAAYAGEEAKPLLLEILNSTVPLKEGMKLEGFTVAELEQKYLHSQPSLFEQAMQELKLVETGYKPTFNMIDPKTHENLGPLNPTDEDLIPRPIDMNNLVVEDPVYLSLELEGMENSHIKELEIILRELHYNTGNSGVISFEQFAQHAGTLYGEYRSHVRMLDQDDFDPEFTKWTIAIHLQDTYWESFRGRTITILKLFNKLYNPDDKLYHLETPITGMKKR